VRGQEGKGGGEGKRGWLNKVLKWHSQGKRRRREKLPEGTHSGSKGGRGLSHEKSKRVSRKTQSYNEGISWSLKIRTTYRTVQGAKDRTSSPNRGVLPKQRSEKKQTK